MGLWKSKLRWEARKVSGIDDKLRRAMYGIYAKYYDRTSFTTFSSDLNLKTDVILLFDNERGALQGFSTLVEISVMHRGKRCRVIFSGDTVIEKQYWGQRTLGIGFLAWMFLKKVKKPWRPLYWFLISKGYKTYLLMANNFSLHYPRYEEGTPTDVQDLIEAASNTLFPGYYQRERGVLLFPAAKAACLKLGVANIDAKLLTNPRIRFFTEKNPLWHEGEELACIAEMKLTMPLNYYVKSLKTLMVKTGFLEMPPISPSRVK